MDWMHQLFSYVCGQVNVWAVGGEALPFCQRCTGLYVGGFYAVLLMALFRPAPSLRLLAIHLVLLVQMVPFGYHLVAQGAILRTVTGQLFAIGLVYCLFLNPLAKLKGERPSLRNRSLPYALAALAGLPALLLAIQFGGPITARVLAVLGLAGLAAYVVLAAANLITLPLLAWQMARARASSQ